MSPTNVFLHDKRFAKMKKEKIESSREKQILEFISYQK
jgi:hypothetical protein